MNLYEFVTPSDAITFKAVDDQVAFWVALYLGNGKAGLNAFNEDLTERTVHSTFIAFTSNAKKYWEDYLGSSLDEFLEQNHKPIGEALSSFAYTTVEGREAYDNQLNSIAPEKVAEFKAKHEDEKRSSMSEWVSYAWSLSEAICMKFEEDESTRANQKT